MEKNFDVITGLIYYKIVRCVLNLIKHDIIMDILCFPFIAELILEIASTPFNFD